MKMVFIDEDLKWLKEAMNHKPNSLYQMHKPKIVALLNRLEMAEQCAMRMDMMWPKTEEEVFFLAAWRKAAGK